MTLIQTAKLNGVDPQAWPTDALSRIVSRQIKANELHTLLPWNWNAAVAETRPPKQLDAVRSDQPLSPPIRLRW